MLQLIFDYILLDFVDFYFLGLQLCVLVHLVLILSLDRIVKPLELFNFLKVIESSSFEGILFYWIVVLNYTLILVWSLIAAIK